MDTAGNNRYQLLFTDDDSVPVIQAEKPAKKKSSGTESVAKKTAPAKKKETVANEKENKANVINERAAKKMNPNQTVNKQGKNTNDNKVSGGTNEAKRSVGSKYQSGEGREERNNKRNFGERGPGGENGNERKVRQYNNRDNRDQNRDNRDQNRDQYRDNRDQYRDNRDQNRDNRDIREQNRDNRDQNRENRDYRENREYRDNRDNRGPPRYRNGDRYGKREFDRQSGSDKTGIKAIDKREGAGAHNWGSIKQEIDDINKVNNGAEVNANEKDESATEQPTEQNTTAQQEQEDAEAEQEAKEMTLDEWKALRQQRATKPQYNLRKAGEGEDTTQWKKMIVLNKKKENDSEDEFEFDPSLYPQRVGRLQRITDIQFNFNDSRRGIGGRGRGRGGEGRGGGGRGRGARFEGRNQDKPPRGFDRPQRKGAGTSNLKVDDEHQFPTLG